MERLLTPDEVAELLQIPKTTLYRWKYEGKGPPVAKVGVHLRYRLKDLEQWLENRMEQPRFS